MSNNGQNTPESSTEISKELYAGIFSAFKKTVTSFGTGGYSSQEALLKGNPYKPEEVMSFLNDNNFTNISSTLLSDFELQYPTKPSMFDFYTYLKKESKFATVSRVVSITRDTAGNIATKENAKKAGLGAGVVASAVFGAHVMSGSLNDVAGIELVSGDKNEYVLSAKEMEEYARTVKSFGEISNFFSQSDNIAVFDVGGISLETAHSINSIQAGMTNCSNDLNPVDPYQEIPQSCTDTVELLNTALGSQVDLAIQGLKSGPQTTNNAIKMKMIEEFQSLRQSAENDLAQVPEGNNIAKILATLALIMVLASLLYWVSQTRRSQRKDLDASENIDKARSIDDDFNPIQSKISALIGKIRNSKIGIDSISADATRVE